MAPTQKEKSKDDLDDDIFKFQDKKEDLDEVLGLLKDALQPLDKVDKALGNSTLNMLVDKWETIVKCNLGNARSDEENKKQTRYKFLRKQLMEIKLPIEGEVEEYPTVPVQRKALLAPKSDVISNPPNHTITSVITFP